MRLRISLFLVLLFIGPAFFALSHGHTAIPAEQNITKDFMLSDEYTTHEESSLLFDETLPHDTSFYPDGFYDSEQTPELSYQGLYGDDASEHNSHSYTHKVDGQYYGVTGYDTSDAWLQLDFQCPSGVEGFTISFYCQAFDFDDETRGGDLEIYDTVSTTWDDKGDLNTSSGWQWVNYTIHEAEYWDTDISIRAFRASGGSDDTLVYVDYAEVTFYIMTLGDSDHYAESFVDVSDWTDVDLDSYGSTSTDNDVASIETRYEGGTIDWTGFYTDSPNFTSAELDNLYLELRYKGNVSGGYAWRIKGFAADGMGGASYNIVGSLTKSTAWRTYRLYLGALTNTLECLYFQIGLQSGNPQTKFDVDYLRISPSDEMGYQHDCSTTYNTDNTGMEYSSDGDHIQAEHMGGASASIDFMVDTTSTYSRIDPDYYPFLSWYCVNVSDDYTVQVLTSGGPQTLYTNISETGIVRANVRAVTADDYYSILFVTDNLGDTIALDFVGSYSMANWTVSQSGAGVDDYLYVDSGVLYSVGTFSYFELADDWDPDVNTAIYDTWNITQSATAAVNVSWYVGGWSAWSDETSGTFAAGTLTHQLIRIYGAGHLTAIKFLGILPQWHTVISLQLIFDTPDWYAFTVIIRFVTPTNTTGLEWFMVFLGLIMIPASTMYFVRGGRDGLSRDKIFFTLVIFFVGWALLIGGIMP